MESGKFLSWYVIFLLVSFIFIKFRLFIWLVVMKSMVRLLRIF